MAARRKKSWLDEADDLLIAVGDEVLTRRKYLEIVGASEGTVDVEDDEENDTTRVTITGGGGWSNAYNPDFRALPNADILGVADGVRTIGGLSLYLYGVAGFQSANVVNGSGIVLVTKANIAAWSGGILGWMSDVAPDYGTYAPTEDWELAANIQQNANLSANGETLGLAWRYKTGATLYERARIAKLFTGGANQWDFEYAPPVNGAVQTIRAFAGDNMADNVYVVRSHGSGRLEGHSGVFGASDFPKSTYFRGGYTNPMTVDTWIPRASVPGFMVFYGNGISGTGASNAPSRTITIPTVRTRVRSLG